MLLLFSNETNDRGYQNSILVLIKLFEATTVEILWSWNTIQTDNYLLFLAITNFLSFLVCAQLSDEFSYLSDPNARSTILVVPLIAGLYW